MKDNCLTLKDKNGKKKDYRILFDVEDTNKHVNYVIYTDDKKDKNGSVKCDASTYVLSDKGNMTKLKPVDSVEEFDFLERILESLDKDN